MKGCKMLFKLIHNFSPVSPLLRKNKNVKLLFTLETASHKLKSTNTMINNVLPEVRCECEERQKKKQKP